MNWITDILGIDKLNESKLNTTSPLALAYIGDAVFEVLVRSYLITEGNYPVNALHRKATNFVCAKAQAEILHEIQDKLTEDEKYVVRRGRNAKSGTIPKNASVSDYRQATGFEALFGYLYIKGNYERISEIIKLILKIKEKVKE